MHPIKRDKRDASLLEVFKASVNRYAAHRGYTVKKCVSRFVVDDKTFNVKIVYSALIDTPNGEECCNSKLPYGPFLWHKYEPNKLMVG